MSAPPSQPQAVHLLQQAFASHQAGALEQAAQGYLAVLELEPEQADAHHMLGLVYKSAGQLEAAERHIKQAILLRPTAAPMHYNMGNLMSGQGRVDEAVACYKNAIACEGNYPEAYYGLGNMLRERDELRAAAAAFDLALRLKPDYAEARHNRANVLRDLCRPEEAVAELRQVLQLRPAMPEAHYNLALSLFLLGRYEEGAPHYAYRFKTPGFGTPERVCAQPLWQGAPLPDKTLLIHSEQGLGDTLQFMRYVWPACARVGQVIFEVPPPLVRIVSDALGDLALVVAQGTALPPFDAHIPLMSLLGLLPAPTARPYLTPQPARVAQWQARLEGRPGVKVGINWQGNPNARIDRGRSVPLAAYAPLLALPGFRFISLQKNAGSEQLAALPSHLKVETLGDDFDAGADAFLDSAAVLAGLDLFITTDTALAHLAGVVGCPTGLLLKQVPDWRWGLAGELTHWYEKTNLFRQQEPGDWDGPIQAMVRLLESWHSRHGH